MVAGETEKSAPLALVPRAEPPIPVVYQLMELPAEVALRFDDAKAQIVFGDAVTKSGAAGVILMVRSEVFGSLVITGLLETTLILY